MPVIKSDLHPREHRKWESWKSLFHFPLCVHPPHPHKHTAHCSWLSVKRPLSMLRSCCCSCSDTRGRKLHCNTLKTGDLRPKTNTHTHTHTQRATHLQHACAFPYTFTVVHSNSCTHTHTHTHTHTQRQAECDTIRGKLNHSVETGGDSGISRDFFSLFWEHCLLKTQPIEMFLPRTPSDQTVHIAEIPCD